MMKFPKVSGENLEKRKFVFPDEFERDLNLVIIAFQRQQQDDIDTWLPVVKHLINERSDLAYYELPTINEGNALFRWWVNTGMRSGISDHQAREHTVTLYLDKETFKQQLHIPTEEQIYIMLINGDGNILWRIDGPWTPEKESELETILFETEQ